MHKYVNEAFEEIEKARGKKKTELMKDYGAKVPYNLLLSLNFDETLEIDLPPGMPPHKRDEATHPDMFQTTLQQQLKRMRVFFKNNPDNIPKWKKEMLFVQLLEGIPPKEADVLVHVKDKALTEMYPSITYDFVSGIFPNYCRRVSNDKMGDSEKK